MARVPSSPARRTYQTGGTLPALTTEFRPIPLGRDSVGDVDAQVRALAVNIRNRADSPVYIREGVDTPDSAEIAPGEEYKIWEPNGVGNLSMKGTNGGENVEVRVLEAHNDFDLTDKIDAFARSLAHFVGTATRDVTVSTFADTVTIDDITASSATFEVDSVAGGLDANVSGNVTVDDILAGSVDANVSGSVTVDDILAGTVDVGTVSGNVTIDDIQSGSVNLTGTADVDVTAQSVGDISTRDIEGTPVYRFLSENGKTGAYNSSFGSFISDIYDWEFISNSTYDGFITSLHVRFYTTESTPDLAEHMAHMLARVEIDDGTGFDPVQPAETWSAAVIANDAPDSREVNAERVGSDESVWRWEPANPLKFRAGDDVRIRVQPDSRYGSFTGSGDNESFNVEIGVSYIERRGQ